MPGLVGSGTHCIYVTKLTSVGFNYAFCATVCVLFVVWNDTLVMVAEASETGR